MSEAASQATLRPARPVRRCVRLSALAGLTVSALYGAMGLMSYGAGLLVPLIVVVTVLVVRPLCALRGRTLLDPDRIIVRRSPIGLLTIPISHIGLVEIRRGVLMEWPVLYLRGG